MRKLCKATLTLVTTTIIALTILRVHSAQTTTIYVNPKNSYTTIGQPLTIDVAVSNVTNLVAWQLQLTFNPELLNCVNVTVPEDNVFGGSRWFPPPQIDNTLGNILAFCASEETSGVNASGTLCQIEFNGKTPAISSLSIINEMQLAGTYLQDPNLSLIPFEAIDGTVEVDGSGFEKNVFDAIQNSQIYQTLVLSNSTITSFNYNQNLKMMTFNASGPEATTGSSSVVISKELLNGTIAVLMDSTAICHSQSENATHNFLHFIYVHSMKNIKILLTILGDVNGDRMVDMADLDIVLMAFGSEPGDPDWNKLADLDGDGVVDMADVDITLSEFGEAWSP